MLLESAVGFAPSVTVTPKPGLRQERAVAFDGEIAGGSRVTCTCPVVQGGGKRGKADQVLVRPGRWDRWSAGPAWFPVADRVRYCPRLIVIELAVIWKSLAVTGNCIASAGSVRTLLRSIFSPRSKLPSRPRKVADSGPLPTVAVSASMRRWPRASRSCRFPGQTRNCSD